MRGEPMPNNEETAILNHWLHEAMSEMGDVGDYCHGTREIPRHISFRALQLAAEDVAEAVATVKSTETRDLDHERWRTKLVEFFPMRGAKASMGHLMENVWRALEDDREANPKWDRLCELFPGDSHVFEPVTSSQMLTTACDEIERLRGLVDESVGQS